MENPSSPIRSTSALYSDEDSKSGAVFRPCLREFWLLARFPDTDLGPVDEFLRDANMKASNPIFRELLSPSGSEPQDVREMAAFFASMQRQERRKGGPVSRRTADSHKLIRYQRNGIARLSRAIRQG